ncbi:GNAT family N-acetyltransferase [Streptomyces sp. NPDC058665]|uniref:GNAT family N-acetyltransferase n=1 Tax=Streptomyces sp. NPDC058665 TaxID=3346586 RepID=UPI003651BD43
MTVELRVEPTPEGAPGLDLRPWDDSGVRPLIDIYRDPLLRRWTRIPVTGVADAVRWLELQREGWRSGERLSFAVWEGGRIVGHVVVKCPAGQSDCAEVGYWTAAEARGQGIASRALETLSGWAFGTLAGVTRLELLHQVDNLASCRVAEKTGYVYRQTLPARPPFPLDGHQHVREAPTQ